MKFYKKKAIITGVAGYIGSHLAEQLLKSGYIIYGIDNMINGSKKNVIKLKKFRDFFFYDTSINKFKKQIYAKYFFHFAAISSVNNKIQFNHLYDNNVTGTQKALALSKKSQCKYFFFPSSAAVYGENKKKNKENSQTNPISLYGFTKLYNECQIFNFKQKNLKCNYIIFRLFNIYGNNIMENQESVIPSWLKNIYFNKNIKINNNGNCYRDFLFIDDLIKIFIFFMSKRVKFDIINVGSGKALSLKKLFQIIVDNFVKFKNFKKNKIIRLKKNNSISSSEIKFSVSDNRKLRNFGFSEFTNIKSGIEKTIKKNF
jgi:UDP-glucose 4-epimerase